MPERTTFASVTDVACTCGHLQRLADDPCSPITFDAQMGELHFRYTVGGKSGYSLIYHCPFCGGAAPKSKRALQFALIPPEENARLAKLLAPVKTIRGALKRLSAPEIDDPSGACSMMPEKDGHPSTTRCYRVLTYTKLSKVANVVITEWGGKDGARWALMGKYIGPQPADGGS